MSEEWFSGLLHDTPEDREAVQAQSMNLSDACLADDGDETRLSAIPDWMRRDDQSRMNSCAAHGGTNALEKIEYLRTGKVTQLSRLFLYGEGQKKCGIRGDAGCTLSGIVKAAMHVGVCTEEVVPYGAYRTTFPEAAYEDAKQRKLTATLTLKGGYPVWRSILGKNIGSILCASHWPIEIVNGYARRYKPTGSGGHAYSAMFLADTSDANGRPDVWILNSHIRLIAFRASATFVEELQGRDPFGNIGFTDMTVPGPRLYDWTGANFM